MRAYVSIRGSRSPRKVVRDADLVPGAIKVWPTASLTIVDNAGTRRGYELSYLPPSPGSKNVIVQLLLRMPDAADDKQLWQGTVEL